MEMNTLVTILSRPGVTFEYLEKKYEDVTNPAYDVIPMLLGAVFGLLSFLQEIQSYRTLFNMHPAIVGVIAMLLGAGLLYVSVRYVMAPVTYWLGRALQGNADLEQVRMVIAYSFIPVFFRIPFEFFLHLSGNNSITRIEYWMVAAVGLFIYVWSLIIEVKGLMFFNGFGLVKALINKLPFLIAYGIITYFMFALALKT